MLNIKDKSLMYYLMTTLNKKDITEQDLNTIEAISLDSLYIDGTRNTLDFSVLLLFPKLKQLTISNTILSNIDKGYIEQTNIKKLYLIKSTFSSIESYSILNKLEFLSLQNCYVEDYNLLLSNASNLKHLEIINPIDDNENYSGFLSKI